MDKDVSCRSSTPQHPNTSTPVLSCSSWLSCLVSRQGKGPLARLEMAVAVFAADEDGGILSSVGVGGGLPDGGRDVAQRQAAAPAGRAVRVAAVDEGAMVQRDLPCFQRQVHGA